MSADWLLRPHGTEARARKHYRDGEKPCPPCLAANAQARRRQTTLGERLAAAGQPGATPAERRAVLHACTKERP